MAKIQKAFSKELHKNELRRTINIINWRYHKADLIGRLNQMVSEFNKDLYLISVYDATPMMKDKIEGNESILVKFFFQYTGVEYYDKGSVTIDYENGTVLSISHSDVGFDTVFLHPANSKQSGATHKTLILYSNDCGARISDKSLCKFINSLCLYHMYTSVLFKKSPWLRLRVSLLKLKSFFYSYFDPDVRFKYSTGVYIPLVSLLVSLIALMVSYASMGK